MAEDGGSTGGEAAVIPADALPQRAPKKNIFKKIQDTDTKTVTTYLRYANLCNALCIMTAGVVTLATLGSFNLTTMFIGLYIA